MGWLCLNAGEDNTPTVGRGRTAVVGGVAGWEELVARAAVDLVRNEALNCAGRAEVGDAEGDASVVVVLGDDEAGDEEEDHNGNEACGRGIHW